MAAGAFPRGGGSWVEGEGPWRGGWQGYLVAEGNGVPGRREERGSREEGERSVGFLLATAKQGGIS